MKKVLIVTMFLLAMGASAEELKVGSKAPAFNLTNAIDGKSVTFAPAAAKASVVVFTCNQCPYAKAFEDRIVELGRTYAAKGVKFYAINPNDETQYPEEKAEVMKVRAAAKKYPFPYLKDGDSATARAYGARVTPHVFLVDASGVVRYRGYVDDSAKDDERSHSGLSEALDALLASKEVAKPETRAFGCTIKWRKA
jgi:thiol-disulfide isomerase/thioredoxin